MSFNRIRNADSLHSSNHFTHGIMHPPHQLTKVVIIHTQENSQKRLRVNTPQTYRGTRGG